MKNDRSYLAVRYSVLALCLAFSSLPAWGGLITFDDLDASAGDISLAGIGPYQGFMWKDLSAYTNTPGFPGFNDGIVTAANAAYTAGDALGAPVTSMIISANPFTFLSAELGAGWYDGLSVTVRGLLNGNQLFSRTLTVNTQAAQFITFNFSGINELDIASALTTTTTDPFGCGVAGCSQVTLDDITVSTIVAPTPEPASVVMVAFGLGTLILHLRRVKKVGVF